MSLQELAGPKIHLKLGIREGHGFGFLRNPIIVVAGTSGISLETEVVSPSPDPVFHNDLVWETDKKNLRRFRASNTPIKLECFSIGPNNQRECIGNILLNIKSAQVISSGLQGIVNEKWYKLIGVPPEAKALQPELLLSLTIQEPNSLSQPLYYGPWEGGDWTEFTSTSQVKKSKARSVNEMQKPSLSSHPSSVLSPDAKQGHVQLGPESTCTDTFILTLNVKEALEFELFMKSHLELFTDARDHKPFQLSFFLLGQYLKTKSFGEKNWERKLVVNEGVVLPLRTTLSVLHSYLQENPSIAVRLLCSGQEVAAAEVHIRSLVPTNDIHSFKKEFSGESVFTQNCILVSSSTGSIPIQDGLQPSLKISVKLQLAASPKLPAVKRIEHSSSTVALQAKKIPFQAASDPSSRSDSRQSHDTFIVTEQSGPVWVPVTLGHDPSHSSAQTDSAESQRQPTLKESEEVLVSKASTLRINLNSVTFYTPVKAARINFLFYCPNTSAITSPSSDFLAAHDQQPVNLNGVSAKFTGHFEENIHIHVFEGGGTRENSLHFASATISTETIDQVKKEISLSLALKCVQSEQIVGNILATMTREEQLDECPSKNEKERTFLGSAESNQEVFSQQEIPPARPFLVINDFLTEKSPQTNSKVDDGEGPSEYLSKEALNTNSKKAEETDLRPSSINSTTPMALSNKGYFSGHSSANPHSKILPAMGIDAERAYKIVEELEDWKEKQQEIFLAELKQKEVEHMSRISDEWTAQTKAQSQELKTLADTLSTANKDLRDRLKSCSKREQELQKKEDELNLQYTLKFQELALTAKRLDEEYKLKLSLNESKCSELEERLKDLEFDNKNLRLQLRQKDVISVPNGEGQMCGMTHSQVSKLLTQVDQLEEKLNTTLQSKADFKEKWGRAVREMNQTKLQFAKKADKGTEKGLENLLSKEEAELQNDQRTLEKLRGEISRINLR